MVWPGSAIQGKRLMVHDNLKLNYLISYLSFTLFQLVYSAGIYLFKINNGNIRKICEICSKLMNRIHTLFWCFHYRLWTNKFRLGTIASLGTTVTSDWQSKYTSKKVKLILSGFDYTVNLILKTCFEK